MAKRCVKARISGRVQGVFFRASTQAFCNTHAISGWVKNTDDGSVELQANGDATAIDKLITWLHHGPPSANVTRVDISDCETHDINSDTTFEVR